MILKCSKTWRSSSPVTDVEFGPGGARIASRADDHTVRVWDVATLRPIGAPYNAHTQYALGVAFSPNGKQLLVTDPSAMQGIFPRPAVSAWPSLVCAKLTPNMSRQQWRQLVPGVNYVQLCPGVPIAPDSQGS